VSKHFDEEARRLRTELEAEPFTPGELEQGWRRLSSPPRPKRWLVLLAPAIAIAVIVLLALMIEPEPEPTAEGLVIASGQECVHQTDHEMLIVPCSREVLFDVGTEAHDVKIRRGRARFSVKKRSTEPFTIAVSHGWIVVIGTRFTVEQSRRSGKIEVEEGVVEFRWNDGSPAERLPGGSSLEWPRAKPEQTVTPTVTAPPPPEPPAPPPKKKQISARDLMSRLFQLKSQRRYDDAIELLEQGRQRADFSEAQRERLSFELGTVLRQSGRTEDACKHLRDHLRKYPSASQKAEIDRILAGCR
jgi:hypothetical protein